MLTVKMVRFGRRALGLTFGTTMTTSSVPVALGAASQKVLAAVKKCGVSTGKRPQLHWKQLWQSPQGSEAWRRWSAMPPTRQSLHRSRGSCRRLLQRRPSELRTRRYLAGIAAAAR